jgi:Zn ribbon nucleic-acid-binding protein
MPDASLTYPGALVNTSFANASESNAAVQAVWHQSLNDATKSATACPYCNDPRKQQSFFNETGLVTHVLCIECGAQTNWSVGDGQTIPKTLLTNLDILRPGDHVAWRRPCAIWHHAIVFDVDLTYKEVEVIHYTGAVNERLDGAFASVRRQWVPVDVEDKDMYRIDYLPADCHSPEHSYRQRDLKKWPPVVMKLLQSL